MRLRAGVGIMDLQGGRLFVGVNGAVGWEGIGRERGVCEGREKI